MTRCTRFEPSKLFAFILLAILAPATHAWSAEGEEPGEAGLDFTDRIVVVNFKSQETVEYLEKVELREVGGRTCLIGTAAESGFEEERWIVGAQVIIDWEEVAYLYSLTNEQYHEMLEGSESVIVTRSKP